MKDKNLPIVGLGIGLLAVITFAVYQYITLQKQIEDLKLSLQQAQKTIKEQEGDIESGQRTLKERELEIDRKEKEIQEKETQIQDQLKQLQVKENEVKNQKSEIARQENVASTLRANTETLGVCLQGVSLAILARTPIEAATALNAIEAKCEEAAEIVEDL